MANLNGLVCFVLTVTTWPRGLLSLFFFFLSLGTLDIKIDTTGGTSPKNAQKHDELRDRMRSHATIALKYFPLTAQEELQDFICYLRDQLDAEITAKKAGSLILTVHCRSVEILERLWKDYCSGNLNMLAEECFLTDERAKAQEEMGEKSEDDTDTVGLETTILKEDYLRCKTFLTEISGKLSSQGTVSHLRSA